MIEEVRMKVTPYISFNGNCEEAVLFYKSVIGGEAQFMRFSDLPQDAGIPISNAWKSKVMHGSLSTGGATIFFGDSWEEDPVSVGSNCTIHINVDSEDDVSRIVAGLAEGGTVTMPAERTFWGSNYGSLVDKYGVCWGVEYEIPE
jgi:PhnB protein